MAAERQAFRRRSLASALLARPVAEQKRSLRGVGKPAGEDHDRLARIDRGLPGVGLLARVEGTLFSRLLNFADGMERRIAEHVGLLWK